ncbi:MAG: alcohol dehydrogenase catalytic domain-containing protein [Candidatus Bathyarchaeia archaeon]
MKAVVKTKKEPGIELMDIETPSPGPKQILLKVKAAGICGTDVHIYEWTRDWGLPLPLVLGHEFTGIIAECGREVKDFQKGDRIICTPYVICGKCVPCKTGKLHLCENAKHMGLHMNGGFAEYVLIPENVGGIFRVPESVTFEEAALCEPLGVALHAIEISQIKPGDSAIVIGAGPIGILLMQILKASGVTIIGLQRSQYRLNLARSLGLNVFHPEDENFKRALKEIGGRVDAVFEVSGDHTVISKAVEMVKSGGEVILVGVYSSASVFNFTSLIDREISIKASFTHPYQTWQRALSLIANRVVNVKPLITSILPLDEAIKGLEILREKKAVKVLLAPDQ